MKINSEDGSCGIDIKSSELDILADKVLNGRQIKNALRTAKGLADYRKEGLSIEHLLQVVAV